MSVWSGWFVVCEFGGENGWKVLKTSGISWRIRRTWVIGFLINKTVTYETLDQIIRQRYCLTPHTPVVVSYRLPSWMLGPMGNKTLPTIISNTTQLSREHGLKTWLCWLPWVQREWRSTNIYVGLTLQLGLLLMCLTKLRRRTQERHMRVSFVKVET